MAHTIPTSMVLDGDMGSMRILELSIVGLYYSGFGCRLS